MTRARLITSLVLTVAATMFVGACTPPSFSTPITGVYSPLIAPGIALPLTINGCTDHDATVRLSITQLGVTEPIDEVYEWGYWKLADDGLDGPQNLLAYHGQSSQPGGQVLGAIAAGHCFAVTLSGYYYVLGYTVSW